MKTYVRAIDQQLVNDLSKVEAVLDSDVTP